MTTSTFYRLGGQSKKWIEKKRKTLKVFHWTKLLRWFFKDILHSKVKARDTPYCRITFSLTLLVSPYPLLRWNMCILVWSSNDPPSCCLLRHGALKRDEGHLDRRLASERRRKKSTSLRCDCPMCPNDFYTLVFKIIIIIIIMMYEKFSGNFASLRYFPFVCRSFRILSRWIDLFGRNDWKLLPLSRRSLKSNIEKMKRVEISIALGV